MKKHLDGDKTAQVVIQRLDTKRFLAIANHGTGYQWVPEAKHAKKFPSRYAAKQFRNRTDLDLDTEIVQFNPAISANPSN
jgi:hypothetical protein